MRKAEVREKAFAYRLKKYGLTPAKYRAMLRLQGGTCAICGRPPRSIRLHVDHNHKTGKVRALLCYFCNRRVVGRHTLKSARQLLDYMEKYDV